MDEKCPICGKDKEWLTGAPACPHCAEAQNPYRDLTALEEAASQIFCTEAVPPPQESLTLEILEASVELVKALAPKESPPGVFRLDMTNGLKIIKNTSMPGNTIMVSKDLFDKIYEVSHE